MTPNPGRELFRALLALASAAALYLAAKSLPKHNSIFDAIFWR